jgi:putative ABC transport system ATP-binding protein
MEIQIAVQCEGVIKEFGSGSTKQRVLHGIDWQVPLGATTFLVGPSGCGKTTLISIIAGLLSATAGRVRILGQETTKMRKGARRLRWLELSFTSYTRPQRDKSLVFLGQ